MILQVVESSEPWNLGSYHLSSRDPYLIHLLVVAIATKPTSTPREDLDVPPYVSEAQTSRRNINIQKLEIRQHIYLIRLFSMAN